MIVPLETGLDSRAGIAARALLMQILDGRVPQGSRLSEVRLAKELELSRGPIREALRRLEQQGVVTFIPNHGTFVARVGRVEALEAIELRERLEPFAYELAAARRGHAIAGRLLHAHEAMRASAETGRLDGFARLHADFHGVLYEQSGHGALAHSWRDLYVTLVLHMNSAPPSLDRARAIVDEHEQLAARLIEADPAAGGRAILDHLAQARAAVTVPPGTSAHSRPGASAAHAA